MAAIDFPAAPTINQEVVLAGTTYVFDGIGWKTKGGESGGHTVAETPPAAPTQGAMWYESDTGIMWMWYDDGTSQQWVQVNGGGSGATSGGGGGIPEAPADGVQYGRQNTAWTPIVANIDSYTKAESDAANAAQNTDISNRVLRAGDTMTGNLAITNAAVNTLKLDLAVAPGGVRLTSTDQTSGAPAMITLNGAHVDLECTGHVWATAPTFAVRDPAGAPAVGISVIGSPNVDWALGSSIVGGIDHNGNSWNFYTSPTKATGQYMLPNGSAWVAYSDARLPWKVTAAPVTDVLGKLADVKLYSGVGPSGKTEMFVKAQELATLLPELVDIGSGPEAQNTGYVPNTLGDVNAWGVMYDRAGVVALQAIKELSALVTAQAARITALEAQIAARR